MMKIYARMKPYDSVQREDTWLCDKVQRGVESPGYGVGRIRLPLIKP